MARKPKNIITIITILIHYRQTKNEKERKGKTDEDNRVHRNIQNWRKQEKKIHTQKNMHT